MTGLRLKGYPPLSVTVSWSSSPQSHLNPASGEFRKSLTVREFGPPRSFDNVILHARNYLVGPTNSIIFTEHVAKRRLYKTRYRVPRDIRSVHDE